CPDLLADLKADAAYKVNKGINRQIEVIQRCVARYGEQSCAGYGGGYASRGSSSGMGGTLNGAESGGPMPPQAGPKSGGSGAQGKDRSAASYSETNTKVKGVDEADIVKNDGKNLYVLHGRAFKVLNAWPANELRETGSIDVEGQPTEMFVNEGKVV